MQAAIYVRLSNDRTGEGRAVERQEEDCRALAAARGWTIARVYSDNSISAYTGKRRPDYEAMLAAVERREVDVVIAWSHDRLHRRPIELERYVDICEKAGVNTYTVKAGHLDLSTPSGRAVARTLAAWASYEVETNAERRKRARLQEAQAGLSGGGCRAFGYDRTGNEPLEPEASIYRDLCKRLIGGEPLGSLVDYLNNNGILTVRGNKWSRHVLKQTLIRKRYIGIRTHHEDEYPAVWEPLIDLDTYAAMQLVLRANAALITKRGRARRYLLTGFAVCGRCGNALTCHRSRNHPDQDLTGNYHCRKFNPKGEVVGCNGISRCSVPLDEYVVDQVMYRLDSGAMAEALARLDEEGGELEALYNAVQARRLKLDEIAESFGAGEMQRPAFVKAMARAEEELAEAEARLTRETDSRQMAYVPPAEEIQAAWEAADLDWRRSVLALLIEKVVVNPQRKRPVWKDTKMRFDPGAIEIVWNV